MKTIRFWDRADRTPGAEDTVGVLVRSDGQKLELIDIIRFKSTGTQLTWMINNLANLDGPNVEQKGHQ